MKRTLLLIFLILTLLLIGSSAMAEEAPTSGACGENLSWILENGVLTISGTGDMDDYTEDSGAPWYDSNETIENVVVESDVTSIGSCAFYYCNNLTSVSIPDSVTSIGNCAFKYCSSLTDVFAESISIEEWLEIVFDDCEANPLHQGADLYFDGILATDIVIPDGITSIGSFAFSGCNLISITIPASVTSISDEALASCTALEKVTFSGETMPAMGNDVFAECTALTTIVCIEGSQVEEWAVESGYEVEYLTVEEEAPTSGTCGENLTWTLDESYVLTITGDGDMYDYAQGEAPWYSYCGLIYDVNFDGDVTSIGDYAFFGLSEISGFSLPDTVTSIGESAFGYCENLLDFFCPESLTVIGDYTFESCYNLCEFYANDNLTTLGKGVFYDCGSMYYIDLPDTVTTLGKGVFEDTEFSSFTIPAGVTVIPEKAFNGNGSLSKVTIHDNVTEIGASAFAGCDSLTEITIPASVTSIGGYAFAHTDTQITIKFLGGTAPTMGEDVFDVNPIVGCFEGSDVEKWAIEMGYEVEYLSPYLASGECGEGTTFALSYDGVLTLSGTGAVTDTPWLDSEDFEYHTLIVESGVTSLCDYAFVDANLTSVTLAEGLVSIGSQTFVGNDFTTIVLPSTLTEIGSSAFYFCENLQSINIPAGVSVIRDNTFNECYALTSISLSEGLTVIERDSFVATKLESIEFPSTLTTIGSYAFYGCHFTELVIPDSVTSIGGNAFSSSTELEMVTFLGTDMPTVSSSTFNSYFKVCCLKGSEAETWALENGREVVYLEVEAESYVLTLPAGVKVIEAEAFDGSVATDVILPAGIEQIGSRAFADCAALTRVVIPGETIVIADDAFEGCEGITFICPDGSDAADWADAHGFAHSAE